MENYSLSDIAAATGNDCGFGGNSAWVLIILFALIFGNSGFGGFGNRGDYGQYATAASQQDILFSSKFEALDNKIDRIGNGIADATFALNNSVTSEGRGIQMQLADCCCKNQKNTDDLRYDMSQMFASTNANITNQTQKILDTMSTNKIADLQNQVNMLQMQNMMCGVVKYPMLSAYSSGSNPFCGNGCGCPSV